MGRSIGKIFFVIEDWKNKIISPLIHISGNLIVLNYFNFLL